LQFVLNYIVDNPLFLAGLLTDYPLVTLPQIRDFFKNFNNLDLRPYNYHRVISAYIDSGMGRGFFHDVWGKHVYMSQFNPVGSTAKLLKYDYDFNLIWSLDIPYQLDSSYGVPKPVKSGTNIIVMGTKQNTGECHVYAVDMETGLVAWQHDLDVDTPYNVYPGMPAVDVDTQDLIIACRYLYRISTAGERVWKNTFETIYLTDFVNPPLSPVLKDGKVMQQTHGHVIVVDAETGDTLGNLVF